MTLDALNPILQWLNIHPNLAGLVTFIISASESIAIIGTIIPGSITMTAIGTLAGAGVVPLWSTLLWGILGALTGDNLSYWTGRYFKDRLPQVWPFRTYPQLLVRGEKFIHENGIMSVFIGRFIGPVRALVPIVAGMLGMRPIRYIIISIIASILWAPLYMLPGILIGKAALELPPDVAVHAIMTCLLAIFMTLLGLWIAYKIFVSIQQRINQILNVFWLRLARSRFFYIITRILKHHDPKKTHGQLTLAFYLFLTCLAFMYLCMHILVIHSGEVTTNIIFFHLFRSLRNVVVDNVMFSITLLGDKFVLGPCMLVAFVWLLWKKHVRTALHLFALLALTVGSVLFFKHLIHSPRPWGITNSPEAFSFPSGHTAITIVFYFGLALLISVREKTRPHCLLFFFLGCFSFAVATSRIYLGAHWVTDVIGGLLISSIILMLVTLSYNRKPAEPVAINSFTFVVVISLFTIFSTQYIRHIDQLRLDYSPVEWPMTVTTSEAWWTKSNPSIPLYRIGRLGLPAEAFNLQWIGNLDEIKAALMKAGWEIPPENNWISVLHRIADVSSMEHLPWVNPLYLDKKPVLVLTKHLRDNKNLIVLRLWNSNILIKNTSYTLLLGSVGAVPRTYSWLITYKNKHDFVLNSTDLFNTTSNQYTLKTETAHTFLKRKKHWQTESIILIEPSTLTHS